VPIEVYLNRIGGMMELTVSELAWWIFITFILVYFTTFGYKWHKKKKKDKK